MTAVSELGDVVDLQGLREYDCDEHDAAQALYDSLAAVDVDLARFAAEPGLRGKTAAGAVADANLLRQHVAAIRASLDTWLTAHGVARAAMRLAAGRYPGVLAIIPDPYVLGHIGDNDPKNQAAIQSAYLAEAKQRQEQTARQFLNEMNKAVGAAIPHAAKAPVDPSPGGGTTVPTGVPSFQLPSGPVAPVLPPWPDNPDPGPWPGPGWILDPTTHQWVLDPNYHPDVDPGPCPGPGWIWDPATHKWVIDPNYHPIDRTIDPGPWPGPGWIWDPVTHRWVVDPTYHPSDGGSGGNGGSGSGGSGGGGSSTLGWSSGTDSLGLAGDGAGMAGMTTGGGVNPLLVGGGLAGAAAISAAMALGSGGVGSLSGLSSVGIAPPGGLLNPTGWGATTGAAPGAGAAAGAPGAAGTTGMVPPMGAGGGSSQGQDGKKRRGFQVIRLDGAPSTVDPGWGLGPGSAATLPPLPEPEEETW